MVLSADVTPFRVVLFLCDAPLQLLSENRLSFQLFSVVLVLAQNHPEADWVAKLGQHLASVHTHACAATQRF
jgi:hypothetical protein